MVLEKGKCKRVQGWIYGIDIFIIQEIVTILVIREV